MLLSSSSVGRQIISMKQSLQNSAIVPQPHIYGGNRVFDVGNQLAVLFDKPGDIDVLVGILLFAERSRAASVLRFAVRQSALSIVGTDADDELVIAASDLFMELADLGAGSGGENVAVNAGKQYIRIIRR